MQPHIEGITQQLLERAPPRKRMEVLTDFAYQLPTLVTCDMLGVEEQERTPKRMMALTRAIADAFIVFETRALSADEMARANEQMDFLYDYFGAVFDRRRADPRGDLTSALGMPSEDGDQLSRRELATVVRFESSLQASYRTALTDTQVLGKLVKNGGRVLCIVGAANRDPAVFKSPDEFDISRKDSRMLLFGASPSLGWRRRCRE